MIALSTKIQSPSHKAVLLDSLERWIKYCPEEKIVIVDSFSSDKSYFKDVESFPSVSVEDINNEGFEPGAWWHIFNKYPDEKLYYFFQDNILVHRSLEAFLPKSDNEVSVLSWGASQYSQSVSRFYKGVEEIGGFAVNDPIAAKEGGWAQEHAGAMWWAKDRQGICEYDFLIGPYNEEEKNISMERGDPPWVFPVVSHGSFIATNFALKKVKTKGLDKVIVREKMGSQAFERIWGVAFFVHEKFTPIAIPYTHITKTTHGHRS